MKNIERGTDYIHISTAKRQGHFIHLKISSMLYITRRMVPRDKVDGYHFFTQCSAQQTKWYFFFESEIENHRQERDKHTEGKAKERIWQ